jgi:hypothetical protein
MNTIYGKIKKISLTAIVAALMLISFAGQQTAFASELSSATENLSASTNQLIEAKDGAGENALSEEEDIAYRKRVVSDALTLSFKEVESARAKLGSIKLDEESDLGKIKKNILDWLDTQEKYFREAENKLSSEELDLEGIKNLARDIKAHRDENYNKDLGNALNFILALETSKLTDTASDRWNKISSDLQKIEKAGLIKKDLFSAEMAEAKEMINGARALAEKSLSIAKDIYLPAPEEEDAVKTSTVTDKATVAAEEIPDSRELCEAAIVNLKSGYGEFVKISASVKKLLKLP